MTKLRPTSTAETVGGFREEDAPNPLTIQVTEWSTGVTKLGEAEFMNGVDRNGNRWSVLVGPVVLRKRLIEGLVEKWDDDEKAFVEVDALGRIKPGEVVSIKYLGDREGAQFNYPDFKVSRKPPTGAPRPKAPSRHRGQNDDIPF